MIETRLHGTGDGRIVIERIQDVEPILDLNKALQNTPQRTESFRHIGTIPNIILERWMNESDENILRMSSKDFDRFIHRKLRDPDWAWLRTDTPGTKYVMGARV